VAPRGFAYARVAAKNREKQQTESGGFGSAKNRGQFQFLAQTNHGAESHDSRPRNLGAQALFVWPLRLSPHQAVYCHLIGH